MSFLMLVIGFVVVLGPLVFFHELGHFFMAKRAGIRVLEFGFGFPPRLFKFRQGQGHLSVGSTRIIIPANFKGLPRSAVESMQAIEQKPEADATATDAQPAADGLDVGAHVNVIAEHGASDVYTLRKMTVLDPDRDDVSPQHRLVDGGVQIRGELTEYVPGTIYSVNWLLPLGGFVRMLGEEDPSAPDSFAAAPKRRRIAVLLAGPLMNILVAMVVLTAAWMVGAPEPITCRVAIERIGVNTPAEAAGLQPQDVILKANDEPMDRCNEFSQYVREHAGQQVVLQIERNDQITLVPVTLRGEGQYNPAVEGPLGINVKLSSLTWTTHRVNVLEALFNTLIVITSMIAGILALPFMLLSGVGLSSLLGPIGISQAGGEAIEMSQQTGTLFPLLILIGQVSVAVGLTNLLPFPALDGGRLLFVIVEWLRGRRVDPRKEMIIHLVGLGLLLIIAALISYGDIVRWLSGQRLF